MLLMGDEVRPTQQGNNNADCQDNETGWFDWNLCATNADLVRFVQQMIRLRLRFDQGIAGGPILLDEYLSTARIEWHGIELGKPDWGKDSRSLAVALHSFDSSQVRYIAINAYWEPLAFQLPPVTDSPNAGWLRLIDTSLPSPGDIVEGTKGLPVSDPKYLVNPQSVVMLCYDYAARDQVATG